MARLPVLTTGDKIEQKHLPVHLDPTTMTAATTASRARANHTGTQLASTVSDFTEAVHDAVAALLIAGSNVSLAYDDTGGTLTITATGGTGGVGGTDPETVRDLIGTTLVAGTNVTITVSDVLDTVTLATPATVNSTDAALRDRATHTGLQAIATVTGLQTALNNTATAAEGDLAVSAVQPATLTAGLATKASVPTGAKNAVVQVSGAVGDTRVGGADTSYSVMWITTYSTAPTNFITDLDLWFPPAV